MEVNGILIGVNVDIQRTDGRVHSAIISGINNDTRSCTVEWYEKGEAKGKEIELEAIYQLNPSLLTSNTVAAAPVIAAPSTRATLSKDDSNFNPSTAAAQRQNSNLVSATAGGGAGVNSSRIPGALRRAPVSQVSVTRQPQQQASVPDDSAVASSITPTPAAAFARPVAAVAVAVADENVAGSRKSNTVKEIERIQAQREERRAAQRAAREQPDYDPSQPQYHFLQMIREYQATLDYRPLTGADPIDDHQICVCVRKRPLNKKEQARKEMDVITIPNKEHIVVHEPKLKVDLTKYLENQNFRFDYAFDLDVDNALVYRYTAQPLVESMFEGGVATCFAYGQTGSGKTHTMGGDFTSKGQQDCSKGIYALAARDVFRLLKSKYKSEGLFCEAAFFEIYSGKVFDLLNRKAKLRVLEDGKAVVNVVGLKLERVDSVDEVLRLLQVGHAARTSGQTSANLHSSRSHAVFQLMLRRTQSRKLHGKFSLIDLAGNERGADTNSSDRVTRMEGAEINKSLLALKECIRALGRKGAHLPFRASKLTQVLRDSFIGSNARTCMIATISPGMSCCEHTLNTLRYADRVKELGVDDVNSVRGGGAVLANNYPQHQNLDDLEDFLTNDALSDSFLDAANDADDPLTLLRSMRRDEAADAEEDEEVTQELMQFDQVVNHIEAMEEDINDAHSQLCDEGVEWLSNFRLLYGMSDKVDYDVDEYSSKLEATLTQQIGKLSALRDKVVTWRLELRQEEELSNKMQARKAAAAANVKKCSTAAQAPTAPVTSRRR